MKSLYESIKEQNELQQIEEGKILNAIGRSFKKFFNWLFTSSNKKHDKSYYDKYGQPKLKIDNEYIEKINKNTPAENEKLKVNNESWYIKNINGVLKKILETHVDKSGVPVFKEIADLYYANKSKELQYISEEKKKINQIIKNKKQKNNKNSDNQKNNLKNDIQYYGVCLGMEIFAIIAISKNSLYDLSRIAKGYEISDNIINKFIEILCVSTRKDTEKSLASILTIFINKLIKNTAERNLLMKYFKSSLTGFITFINKEQIKTYRNIGFTPQTTINNGMKNNNKFCMEYIIKNQEKPAVKENKHSLYSYYCRIVEELDDNLIWKLNKWFEMNEQQEQEFISILSAYKSNNMNASISDLLEGTTLYDDIKTFVNFLYDDLDISSEKDYLYQFKKILDAVKNNKSDKNKYILY